MLFRSVAHPVTCHRVMDWIAAAHQRATGITTVYHDAEDDLLANIRAAISR